MTSAEVWEFASRLEKYHGTVMDDLDDLFRGRVEFDATTNAYVSCLNGALWAEGWSEDTTVADLLRNVAYRISLLEGIRRSE